MGGAAGGGVMGWLFLLFGLAAGYASWRCGFVEVHRYRATDWREPACISACLLGSVFSVALILWGWLLIAYPPI